jgi:transposase-like protein
MCSLVRDGVAVRPGGAMPMPSAAAIPLRRMGSADAETATLPIVVPAEMMKALRAIADGRQQPVGDLVTSLLREELMRRSRRQTPRKMTPAMREAFCALMRQGHSRSAAAGCCGMSRQTVYYWIRNDAEFARGVADAEEFKERIAAAAALRAAAPSGENGVRDRGGRR